MWVRLPPWTPIFAQVAECRRTILRGWMISQEIVQVRICLGHQFYGLVVQLAGDALFKRETVMGSNPSEATT